LDTSEQEVLNCGSGTCSGGYVQGSSNALTKLGYGLVSEADLPYKRKKSYIRFLKIIFIISFLIISKGIKAANCSDAITADKTRHFARFNGGVRGSSGTANDAQLLTLLKTYGPITVLINADSGFMNYAGGIYSSATCNRNYFSFFHKK
jgi:hypothetical protein